MWRVIDARKRGSCVVRTFPLALQRQKSRGQCHTCRLRLKLHRERQIQKVLFRRYKEKRLVFRDGPPNSSSELVLNIDRGIAKGVRRGKVRVAVGIESFAMPAVSAGLG